MSFVPAIIVEEYSVSGIFRLITVSKKFYSSCVVLFKETFLGRGHCDNPDEEYII